MPHQGRGAGAINAVARVRLFAFNNLHGVCPLHGALRCRRDRTRRRWTTARSISIGFLWASPTSGIKANTIASERGGILKPEMKC